MRACLAGLLLLASTLCHGQLDISSNNSGFSGTLSGPQFLPVDEAYQLAVEVQTDGGIRLYWQIADAYYLYQHRFGFTLRDQQGEIPLQVELPPALDREDEYFGKVKVNYHDADIMLQPQRQTAQARLTVKSQGCADAGLCYPPHTQHFELDFNTGSVTAVSAENASQNQSQQDQGAPEAAPGGSLLYMLLLAFVGGSILNLMPCVFPILSLKVLSFTRSSAADRHLHGWIYAAGVVCSFVLVAAVLISLQQAGKAVGWGFQLQSPGFVIALAYLFVVMGLSLSGVLELGSSLMNAGGGLADRGGLSGSFFTGVLAVVVASPCTAPLMGSALGYAAAQPPAVALLVFAALGCGMAAPLLLLSYSSGLRGVMPRPGPWMETLKQLLAFPLYATAIWLFWVVGKQTGVNTMAVALTGALMLAMALWLWRHNRWLKILAVACLLIAFSLGSWRGLDISPGAKSDAHGRLAWSEQQLEELRAAGQPVFLDVTADWCITCIANEQAVLYTDEMTAAFAERGVVYMVADWTNYNADIAAMLRQHGRNGIPLYVLYTGDATREPIILPQLLTKSVVLAALEQVSGKKQEVAANISGSAP